MKPKHERSSAIRRLQGNNAWAPARAAIDYTAALFFVWRWAMKPRPAKPISIIAQVVVPNFSAALATGHRAASLSSQCVSMVVPPPIAAPRTAAISGLSKSIRAFISRT